MPSSPKYNHTAANLVRSYLKQFEAATEDWQDNHDDMKLLCELGRKEEEERAVIIQHASDEMRHEWRQQLKVTGQPIETSLTREIRVIQDRLNARSQAIGVAREALGMALKTCDTTARLVPTVDTLTFDRDPTRWEVFTRSVQACLGNSSAWNPQLVGEQKEPGVKSRESKRQGYRGAGSSETAKLKARIREIEQDRRRKHAPKPDNARLCTRLDTEGVPLPPEVLWRTATDWVDALRNHPGVVRRWLSGVCSDAAQSGRSKNYSA